MRYERQGLFGAAQFFNVFPGICWCQNDVRLQLKNFSMFGCIFFSRWYGFICNIFKQFREFAGERNCPAGWTSSNLASSIDSTLPVMAILSVGALTSYVFPRYSIFFLSEEASFPLLAVSDVSERCRGRKPKAKSWKRMPISSSIVPPVQLITIINWNYREWIGIRPWIISGITMDDLRINGMLCSIIRWCPLGEYSIHGSDEMGNTRLLLTALRFCHIPVCWIRWK